MATDSAPAAPTSSGRNEVTFDVNSPEFSSDEFRCWSFKVKRCPRARPHDWMSCPFAHPGEKAKRRDPKKFQYSGTACPDFRKGGLCPRGDQCPFAHGVFECWLHPSRYRTQMCTDGVNCKRRVCFFAHFESELRKAEVDPILLTFQMQQQQQKDAFVSPGMAYQPQPYAQQYAQQPYANALGALLGPHGMQPSPQGVGFEMMGAMHMGAGMQVPHPVMVPPVVLQGPTRADGSAPCTPTAVATLTPTSSQDGATLLAQLQLLQQAQAQQPGSAPGSAGGSPGGDQGQGAPSGSAAASSAAPARPVSTSASGDTLGSSGSPPISPTGVAGAAEAGIPTPSIPDLAQGLKGQGLSPLAAALLQHPQESSAALAAVAAQLAMLSSSGNGGGGSTAAAALSGENAAALAMLLQQQAACGGTVDQTSLLVALHSLSLGGAPPTALQAAGPPGGLIRHASDVYMQARAAAAVAAAALSPPGQGLVSHRRSMDNSMLAQLHSLSRSSPRLDLQGASASDLADLAMEAARLSPIAVQGGAGADLGLDSTPTFISSAPGVQLGGGSLQPHSPGSYLGSPLTRAMEQQQAAAAAAAALSPQLLGGRLHRIVTSGADGDVSGLNLPPTPQTAPAAMVRDGRGLQLGSIEEGEPAASVEQAHSPTMYKTLSDPAPLGRTLSFDNILAELPRSSSQVCLATQLAAAAGEGSSKHG